MTIIDDANDHAWFRIDDIAAAGSVRRAAARLADSLGFDPQRSGEVGIVATELSTNLAKHATDGSVILRVVRSGDIAGLQILALDSGPGMRDVRLSAEDGRSTSGSLGIGLGAVVRLASAVDGISQVGRGTILLATLWPRATDAPAPPPAAALTRPMTGEDVCGDSCAIRADGDSYLVVVADGLGHGRLAEAASLEAVRAFREASGSPASILQVLHERLRPTRGAAVAIARIDVDARKVTYAGMGNIAGWIVDGTSRRGMLSHPGIVGAQARRARENVYDLPRGATVVVHSDGLRDTWDLGAYPGLRGRDPAVIAATLLRDAGVRHDDASVLVART